MNAGVILWKEMVYQTHTNREYPAPTHLLGLQGLPLTPGHTHTHTHTHTQKPKFARTGITGNPA